MIAFTKNWKNANHLTHAGKFHADEVFASVFLSKVHPSMVLSRVSEIDPSVNRDEVFIYDIGKGEFDHHQQGGNGSRPSPDGIDIKYASCGLVWRAFGKEILTHYLEQNPKILGYESYNQIPDTAIPELHQKIDEFFIQYIDADDNGQELLESNANYQPVLMAELIDIFNPAWNENLDPDQQFLRVVTIAEQIVDRLLARVCANYATNTIVDAALDASENNLLILDRYIAYEPSLLASTHEKAKDILFVVYPSNRNGYSLRTVPLKKGSFKNRKDLPESWAGLSGTELQQVTGVATATFCHNARFLAVADTLEDAIKLAHLALEA